MKKIVLLGFAVLILFILSNKTVFSQEVKIGNQIWSSENLKVTKFRNGDNIPIAKTKEEWEKASYVDKKPIMTYLRRDPESGKKYGVLYNGYAVMDPRGLAPKGWHIASKEEWSKMIKFLGGDTIARKKILSTSGWDDCFGFEKGSNSSGFNALPGGSIDWQGSFIYPEKEGNWWTSTPQVGSTSWGYSRNIDNCGIRINTYTSSFSNGYYVRCVKD